MTCETAHERAAYEAMRNAPWETEALTVDLAVEVLVARGVDRPEAARIAKRVFDRRLKVFPPV
jgi:hypothetical protein